MATWYDTSVLDAGLVEIAAKGNSLRLLKAYAAGDSYATVNATNTIASIALAGGDFTLGNQGTNGREQVVAAKSGTASAGSGGTPDLHIAIVDTVGSVVLAVTDETSDRVILTSDPINVPTFSLLMNQPVAS